MYFVKVKEIKSQHWQDMESKFKLLDKKHEEQLNIIEENHNYRLERVSYFQTTITYQSIFIFSKIFDFFISLYKHTD